MRRLLFVLFATLGSASVATVQEAMAVLSHGSDTQCGCTIKVATFMHCRIVKGLATAHFQRVHTATEQGGLRLAVSIDGVTPTTLQRPLAGDGVVGVAGHSRGHQHHGRTGQGRAVA